MKHAPRVAAVGLLAVAGLWLGAAHSIRAQTPPTPQPQLLLINELSLKPETAPEWADLVKSEGIPNQKKGGVAWRDTWASGPGGDPFVRVTVTPITSMAQFDSPNPVAKAVGEQAFAAYQAKIRRLMAGTRSTIVTTRPDMSFGTRPAEHKLALLSIIDAANGRIPEFEALIKNDVVPALKKGGVTYYSVVQVVFGDAASKYMTLTAISNYAETGKGTPLERALGPEGMAKLTQKAGPLVTRLERRIIRYLPDLSFGASKPTSD